MILIASVDDNMGLMFNHRRQSRDRLLHKKKTAFPRCLATNAAVGILWGLLLNSVWLSFIMEILERESNSVILLDDPLSSVAGPSFLLSAHPRAASRIPRIIVNCFIM